MKTDLIAEPDHLFLGDAQRTAVAVIQSVLKRDDRVEPVVPALELYND
jgi:hypothetical protein